MKYPYSYSVGVPAWVLQGSIGATSKKQHCYFSVGTSAVTVQLGTTLPATVFLLCTHKTKLTFTNPSYFTYFCEAPPMPNPVIPLSTNIQG